MALKTMAELDKICIIYDLKQEIPVLNELNKYYAGLFNLLCDLLLQLGCLLLRIIISKIT